MYMEQNADNSLDRFRSLHVCHTCHAPLPHASKPLITHALFGRPDQNERSTLVGLGPGCNNETESETSLKQYSQRHPAPNRLLLCK